MTIQKQHILKSISLFLTVLILGLILNQALLLHSHRQSDGRVIVHAHPTAIFGHKGSTENSSAEHHHTNNQFQFLDIVQHAIYLVVAALFLPVVVSALSVAVQERGVSIPQTPSLLSPNGRAPPVK